MKWMITICIALISLIPHGVRAQDPVVMIDADDPNILYTGRVDFTDPKAPRFWAPGVYITLKFTGGSCEIFLNDELLNGDSHNYIEVVVDGGPPIRMQLRAKSNRLQVAKDLAGDVHTLTICKNTESGVGYLEFEGVKCKGLVPAGPLPTRKIEFIGNSTTCGSGIDTSEVACDSAKWYDQHNAYLSYGPSIARSLNAQWQLSAASGIGLMKSCCGMNFVMPQVFDKINMSNNTLPWDFKKYQPDVVTVCLGENDGAQDSVRFCNKYLDFLKKIREYYPSAQIVCLNSPMSDAKLDIKLKNYLNSIVKTANGRGDRRVSKYFFLAKYTSGCGGHPNLDEHQKMAEELGGYIKKLMAW